MNFVLTKKYRPPNFHMATPIKFLDLDDTSVQLKQEGSLYIVSICYAVFNQEALFYWVNLGGGWWSFFIYVQN